ncbi:peroxiredoxin-like family protein [Glaciecola sp. 2405UD65-10]|jgi:peroxiredoxin|uniref:peroxiredoxin-like family protein n=1 Tax=Glaciecola sp. 2405UD65-10 TaxID=3397244 RepID=UPI003B5BA082
MKKLILMTFVALVSLTVQAVDRSVIRDNAADVTPILNGTQAPNATLRTADGSPVSLQALLMQKPSVIVFYRGGWCPYCSQQLAELQTIESELVKEGYQILAISPESPEKLQSQKIDTDYVAQLLSDEKLQAISGFGIGFYVEDDTRALYKDRMNVELTPDATDRAVLPAPAIFITNTKGQVVFNYVNPDYKVRPSAELVLSAAKLVNQ